MNGRIFDYNVGRFLGVDPVFQFPTNSQSANPYSYILNNPMAGTDPTGYSCNQSDQSGEHCGDTQGEAQQDSVRGDCSSSSSKAACRTANERIKNGEKNDDNTAKGGKTHLDVNEKEEDNQDGSTSTNVAKVNQVGSDSEGEGTPASVPDEIKIEASGFKTKEAAAIAAGEKYGEQGVKSEQELQLAIVRVGKDDYGYLTPGWGAPGDRIINPQKLFEAYGKAGFKVAAWMHGHWDSELNFSANDFGLVWGKSYPTFMVNRKLEVRKLTNKHLEKAFKSLPSRYKRKKLQGLVEYYGLEGLPGETL